MTDTADDRSGLAIEYALGSLPPDEQEAVRTLHRQDASFAAEVAAWEQRLAPLLWAVADATPSPTSWAKIERRLETSVLPFPRRPDAAVLQRQLRLWRGVALAASLVAFIAVGSRFLPSTAPTALAPTFVAALQKDATAPAFLIGLDEKAQALKVVALGTPAPNGKDYELWIIADGLPAPRSLGVVKPETAQLRPNFNGLTTATIRNATLAISMEPAGGSPTGAPTGPVVFTGKFVAAKL